MTGSTVRYSFTRPYLTLPSLLFWNHVRCGIQALPKGNMITTKRPEMSNLLGTKGETTGQARLGWSRLGLF